MYENNDLLNYIAKKFGRQAAEEMQEQFGGEEFYIPKRKPIDTAQAIIEEHYGTKTVRELSRMTGLSMRQVFRRINKPISKNQQNLFA